MNKEIFDSIKRNWDAIAKPIDGLGLLEDAIAKIGALQNTTKVEIQPRALAICCADNGIVEEGVSQCGSEITREVVSWMGERKSSVFAIARRANVDVFVYDVGIIGSTPIGVIPRKIVNGTKNFLKEEALSRDELFAAVDVGKEIALDLSNGGYKAVALGEMGIGNTTTSAALCSLLLGLSPKEVCGRGAGLSDDGLKKKLWVVEQAKKKYENSDVWDAMAAVGGADIAALCGICLGATDAHIAVVIDGFISAVAALCAVRINPDVIDALLASHMGKERGMEAAMSAIGLSPIIHANMALGEGSGACMLFPILDMALGLYEEGRRFAETSMDAYERL